MKGVIYMRFFARPGEYEPCGIFSWGHLALIIVTIIGIKVALKKTVHKTKKEVKKIIKNLLSIEMKFYKLEEMNFT